MIECYEGDCKWHQKDEPFCILSECQECPNCSKLDFLDHVETSTAHCVFCKVLIRVVVEDGVITSAEEAV